MLGVCEELRNIKCLFSIVFVNYVVSIELLSVISIYILKLVKI
nr:MAG TPA: hypothetical protein [Caudoviricetes sp.]DAY95571.1 MAG TPA: hypothetical protein [Caudoviricetes sp.]